MQVLVILFLLKNLSSVAIAIGKHAGWSWDASKVPPVLEQQLISVPFANQYMLIQMF